MKRTKILLLSAAALVLLGAFLMSLAWWLGIGMPENDRVERSFSFSDGLRSFQIDCDSCDLVLKPGAAGEVGVQYSGDKRYLPTLEERDGTLYVDATDKRNLPWYLRVSFDLSFVTGGGNRMTVTLPTEQLGTLKIRLASGDTEISAGQLRFEGMELQSASGAVELAALSVDGALTIDVASGGVSVRDTSVADLLRIRLASGKTALENVQSGALNIESMSGGVNLTDVTTEGDGAFAVSTASGDIRLTDCDGANMTLRAGSGSIRGTLRTGKVFEAKTSVGKISVPESTGNQKCSAETASGSINLSISE